MADVPSGTPSLNRLSVDLDNMDVLAYTSGVALPTIAEEADTTLNASVVVNADETLVEEQTVSLTRKSFIPTLSKIPRRLSLTVSPPKMIKSFSISPQKSPAISRSVFQPTISSSLKQASPTVKRFTPPRLNVVLPLRIVKKNGRSSPLLSKPTRLRA
jgi:hypothetical protein